ncbi:MAG: DoxX family protein [Rhizobacter sp.]|nr:DoxX family protein [Ferruginibacter sp.]
MNLAHKIQNWEDSKHDGIILIFRVMLGIVITFKGITFLSNITFLDALLKHSSLYRFAESSWVWYIAFTSLLCGIFIITGLFTRIAIILQIPVLIGAVLFINPGEHSFAINGESMVSLAVLSMLFYFLFKGPGEISMDNYLKNHEL